MMMKLDLRFQRGLYFHLVTYLSIEVRESKYSRHYSGVSLFPVYSIILYACTQVSHSCALTVSAIFFLKTTLH